MLPGKMFLWDYRPIALIDHMVIMMDLIRYLYFQLVSVPIPMATEYRAWVWVRWLAGIVGSNPAGGKDVCLLWVLCVVR